MAALLIDIGNTKSAFFSCRQDTLKSLGQMRTFESDRSLDWKNQFYPKLAEAFDLKSSKPHFALVSSVVPSRNMTLLKAFPEFEFRFVQHKDPFSFKIASKYPEQTGVDRLLLAEAVSEQSDLPCIILSSGTGTTIGVLDEQKTYQGGLIAPGLETMAKALSKQGAQLFVPELELPKSVIATTTKEALQSGVVLGYLEMLKGLIHRTLEAARIKKFNLFLTGGAGRFLLPHLKEAENQLGFENLVFDENLVIKGLHRLYGIICSR